MRVGGWWRHRSAAVTAVMVAAVTVGVLRRGASCARARVLPRVPYLARDVVQGVPRHVSVLVEEHLELLHGHADVALVELVGDVPPEGAVLAPLLRMGWGLGEAAPQSPARQRRWGGTRGGEAAAC